MSSFYFVREYPEIFSRHHSENVFSLEKGDNPLDLVPTLKISPKDIAMVV
jgi:hypothetical protein